MSKIPVEVAKYFRNGIRKVTSVCAQPPYTIIATFDDGQRRSIDMTNDLCGVFEPLRDYSLFRNVGISDGGTIMWRIDSGILDIDKDTVYIYGKPV